MYIYKISISIYLGSLVYKIIKILYLVVLERKREREKKRVYSIICCWSLLLALELTIILIYIVSNKY